MVELLQPHRLQEHTNWPNMEVYLVQKAIRDQLVDTLELIEEDEVDTQTSVKGKAAHTRAAKRQRQRARKKDKGVASGRPGGGPAAAKDATAGASSSGGDGPDEARSASALAQTPGQKAPVGPLSRSASSGLSDGGQANGKPLTAGDTATTVLMGGTDPSIAERVCGS